ncbi:MarR family transcriptional regulator [Salinadaptatus halalkaliphilus]|uniref:MarR family transcriptional regulator n=1 Tax=Salinadaptatus halalkaliphilus TaxID=2419781 RepID=A0A4S3TNG0_9EURY|nr:helix-turn-helix domain-containing protein [Salinadaptatus halalkaliphilus]THE65854.1 MarR family transcriptional regulator [Salinadaptatus halalkaliphilus]
MPIDIDTFEGSSEDALGGGLTQPERVLSFLATHADQAFRPVEIAEKTDIPQNSINSVLRRLEEQALVRHKGEYWAITDDRDRLHSLTQYEFVTESLNDLYGEEDPAEWVEHMPATDTAEKTNDV